MSRAGIERLIQEEVTGKRMVPTVKVEIGDKTWRPVGDSNIKEEDSIMKKLGKIDNRRLIVVNNNQVFDFEVEVERK